MTTKDTSGGRLVKILVYVFIGVFGFAVVDSIVDETTGADSDSTPQRSTPVTSQEQSPRPTYFAPDYDTSDIEDRLDEIEASNEDRLDEIEAANEEAEDEARELQRKLDDLEFDQRMDDILCSGNSTRYGC